MSRYKLADYSFEELKVKLHSYLPDPKRSHELYAIIAIEEAIEAIKEGNFGVGACLVKNDQIVERGHNRMLKPYFRSDLHAEMDVMTRFEECMKRRENMNEYILYSSLEPCPMCTMRLINSGVGKVFYVAQDTESEVKKTLNILNPALRDLTSRQIFAQADCSQELIDLAWQAWLVPSTELAIELRRYR